MTLSEWFSRSRRDIHRHGIRGGIEKSICELGIGLLRHADMDYGISPFDADWDVFVILDGCRWDLMQKTTDYYMDVVYSNATSSMEWMQKNLVNQDTGGLAYVTGNIHSEEYLSGDEFCVLDEVWRYEWDHEAGTIPPRPITERAIHHNRHSEYKQLIVHYMQPHYPFLTNLDMTPKTIHPDNRSGDISETNFWQQMERGKINYSRQEVWKAYQENLEVVLEDVKVLLQNVEGDTVISADHGNAFGEFRKYGHGNLPLPAVKRVPWVETSATDTESLIPTTEPENMKGTVERRLRDLGYKA